MKTEALLEIAAEAARRAYATYSGYKLMPRCFRTNSS